MKAEELIAAGIPLSDGDALSVLHAESALEWMREHTTITFDKADAASIAALPACAKLFVVKYSELFRVREGVASQSIEGLSQSFHSGSKDSAVWSLAYSLLDGYLRSGIKVHTAKRRW